MSIALTGFLTGFAEGATERIKREREENEAMIENRLKRAQTNRLLFQKEQDAQKQLYRTRYDSVSAYMPEGATEEQKLALISSDEIAKQFTELRAKGEEVDLNRFLVMNKDKIPKNFSSVQQYIDNISVAPAPVAQEQVDAIRQTRGFLGSRTGANIEKAAGQFGTSAAELLAFEQPRQVERLDNIARMNVDMLRPKKDGDDRLKDAEITVFDAIDKFGKDSPEAKLAASNYAAIKTVQAELDPASATFAKMLDRAKMDVANAGPADKEAAQAALDYLVSIEKRGTAKDVDPNKLTLPQQRSLLNAAATNALTSQYPRYKDDIARQTDPITGDVTLVAISSDEKVAADLRNVQLGALKGMYDEYYSTPDGLPKDQQTKQLLSSMGVQFDESGRPIFKVDVPPTAPDPNKPTRTNPDAARTTPAPAATPAAAAPAAPASGQVASGKVTQATAAAPAAAGDTYRFENLTSSVREAAIRDAERFGIRNLEKVFSDKDEFNSQPLQKRKQLFEAYSSAASAPTNVRNFRSVEEAEAANLPKGTRITINGRRAEVQ